MELGLSGLSSGFDWRSLVDQLIEVERAPQTRLRTEQSQLEQRNNAYGSIETQLNVVLNKVNTLRETALFDSRLASSSDETVATATAGAGVLQGDYAVQISQLATTSRIMGTGNAGSRLSATSDVSGLLLSDAPFATSVTAGTFTVNGQQITIATTDSLQDVFDQISTATSGTVSGSYDPATDTISLSSASEIVLGAATDTSNFLQSARLYNNGTGTITSTSALGVLQLGATLDNSNLATPITAGSGTGEFRINGVSITFDLTDSLSTVISRINSSDAGVNASYDSLGDRLVLTNHQTGDMGIALEDVSGNFLAATGLSGGSLQRGSNLLYSINGGTQLVSQTNTITEASSGITGLSIEVASTGSATISVSSDTETIKDAITSFVDEYNNLQSLIAKETATTTNDDGQVDAGVLANDLEAQELASRLRRIVTDQVPGLAAAMDQLNDLGVISNGEDDTIKIADADALAAALSANLPQVSQLFTDTSNGLAVKLGDYIDSVVAEDGLINNLQTSLSKGSEDIDRQIQDMERLLESRREQMVDSFVAMEQAQARINQQLQYLQQRFGTAS